MEDVCAPLHDSNISGRGVGALAILDGIDKAVSELSQGAQEVLFDEVDHAVVCGDDIKGMLVGLSNAVLNLSLRFAKKIGFSLISAYRKSK